MRGGCAMEGRYMRDLAEVVAVWVSIAVKIVARVGHVLGFALMKSKNG